MLCINIQEKSGFLCIFIHKEDSRKTKKGRFWCVSSGGKAKEAQKEGYFEKSPAYGMHTIFSEKVVLLD